MPNVQERAGEGYNSGIKAGHVASSACSSLENTVFPSCPGWQAFGGGGGGDLAFLWVQSLLGQHLGS